MTLSGLGLSDIPLFLRAGVVVPLRVASANTTTELRRHDFELLVPLGRDGAANGTLYLDDGVTIDQPHGTTLVTFTYRAGVLAAAGRFDYPTDLKIAKVTILGAHGSYSADVKTSVSAVYNINKPLTAAFSIQLEGSAAST